MNIVGTQRRFYLEFGVLNNNKLKYLQSLIFLIGRRFVAILDPGIPTGESDYPAFEEGSDLEVWVKEAQTGLPIQGNNYPMQQLT